MTRAQPHLVAFWFGGHDLTEAQTAFQPDEAHRTAELPLLKDVLNRNTHIGKDSFSITESGVFFAEDGNLREALAKKKLPALWSIAPAVAPGVRCDFAEALLVGQQQIVPSTSDILRVAGITYSVGDCDVQQDGRYIGRWDGASAPPASPYTGHKVDLGAAHPTGGWTAIIVANGINFDSATGLTVKLVDNTQSTGSGWADLAGASATFTPAGGKYQAAYLSGSGALRRWAGLTFSWAGTPGPDKAVNLVAAIRQA